MNSFDFAVIGRGLMGTACARWLAETGSSVVLVGPDEPKDRASFTGPFGSFHDAARITRRVASDPVWSRLAIASIDRYAEVEARSGVEFYHPVGAMMAARQTPAMSLHTSGLETIADSLGAIRMSPSDARAKFGFALPSDSMIVYESSHAGWIDPRQMRLAHEKIAQAQGAQVVNSGVSQLDGSRLLTGDGDEIVADQVVMATGGYARAGDLMSPRPSMQVFARTIAFAEVDTPIAQMPSLIWVPEDFDDSLYLLPPVRYPDGRWLVKIGGEMHSPVLESMAAATEWFQSHGSELAAARLLDQLRAVLPDLSWCGTDQDACAVSFTKTGYPYIARVSPCLTLLTGGNGAAAKCADELGRLGAMVAMGGEADGFEAVFDQP